jgi:hypothetical protein
MLYRVSGTLFFLFGSFQILGHILGGEQPRAGESGFASGQYGGLITGIALCVAGLYMFVKSSSKQA